MGLIGTNPTPRPPVGVGSQRHGVGGLLSAGHSLCPRFPQLPHAICVALVGATVYLFSSLFFSNTMQRSGGRRHILSPYKMHVCVLRARGQLQPGKLPPLPWVPVDLRAGPGDPQTLAHGGWVGWRADLTRRVWVARSPSTLGSLKDSPGHPKARWGPPSWALTRCPWGLGAQAHALALGLRDYSCFPWE